MPVPLLLRVNVLHLLGPLIPRLPSIPLSLASHILCRQAKLLQPHIQGKMAYNQLIDLESFLTSTVLRVVPLAKKPGDLWSGSIRRGFIPDRTKPLARSTCPFDSGWATAAMPSLIHFFPTESCESSFDIVCAIVCDHTVRVTISQYYVF